MFGSNNPLTTLSLEADLPVLLQRPFTKAQTLAETFHEKYDDRIAKFEKMAEKVYCWYNIDGSVPPQDYDVAELLSASEAIGALPVNHVEGYAFFDFAGYLKLLKNAINPRDSSSKTKEWVVEDHREFLDQVIGRAKVILKDPYFAAKPSVQDGYRLLCDLKKDETFIQQTMSALAEENTKHFSRG